MIGLPFFVFYVDGSIRQSAEARLAGGVLASVCTMLVMAVKSKVASSTDVLAVTVLPTISVIAFHVSAVYSFPSNGAALATALSLLMVEQQY